MKNLQETKKALITKFKKFLQNFETATKTKFTQSVRPNFVGFTLAEVLITLGIIGVVAALTLPTLIQNYQKQVYVNQLKKTYSTVSQAIKMYMVTNELNEYKENIYRVPYLSLILREYAGADEARCDIIYKDLRGNVIDNSSYTSMEYILPTNGGWCLKLKDGTYIYTGGSYLGDVQGYYNTNFSSPFWIDVNGAKSPNQLGRDVFAFVVMVNSGIVVPFDSTKISDFNAHMGYGYIGDNLHGYQSFGCAENNADCASTIIQNGWVMDY